MFPSVSSFDLCFDVSVFMMLGAIAGGTAFYASNKLKEEKEETGPCWICARQKNKK